MAKKKKVTHRIPYDVWANSQLSIVRHYGACMLNGKKYVLDKEMPPVIKDGEYKWFPDLVTYE